MGIPSKKFRRSSGCVLLQRTKFVYFFVTDDDNLKVQLLKIGISDCPATRFETFDKNTPLRLKKLGQIFSNSLLEKQLHDELKEYQTKGEWYFYTNKAKAVVARILDN